MAELRNCKRCKKLFQYNGLPLCADCVVREDEEFTKVRDYVKKNKKPSILETSKATEVDEKQIMKFLREGKLERAGYSIDGLTCESCGAAIGGGRLCPKCMGKLSKEMGAKDLTKDAQPKFPAAKMKKEKMFTDDSNFR